MFAVIATALGALAVAAVSVAHHADLRTYADDPALPRVSTATVLSALALFMAGIFAFVDPAAFDIAAITVSIAAIGPLAATAVVTIRLLRIPSYDSCASTGTSA